MINPAVELAWKQIQTATGSNSYLVQDVPLTYESRRNGYAGFTIGGVQV